VENKTYYTAQLKNAVNFLLPIYMKIFRGVANIGNLKVKLK
jgi:hypothetical protein